MSKKKKGKRNWNEGNKKKTIGVPFDATEHAIIQKQADAYGLEKSKYIYQIVRKHIGLPAADMPMVKKK